MPNLLPIGVEEEVITEEDLVEYGPIGYKNGVAFDYEDLGDFKRDGKNRMLDCDGIESWRAWVINCMQTQRMAHLAYSSDFGIDIEAAFAASSRDEAESILTREITEAVLADDYERTEYIESIEFEWTHPDTVRVTAILHGISDVSIDVIAYISNRAS